MSGPGDIDGEVSGDEAAWRDLIARFDVPAALADTATPWPDREDLPDSGTESASEDPGSADPTTRTADPAALSADHATRQSDPAADSAEPPKGRTDQGAAPRQDQPGSRTTSYYIPIDRTRVVRPAGDPRSYSPPDEEDEPYVPVPLPPPAKLDSVSKAALAGVVGGPGYLLIASVFLHWTISAVEAFIAVAAFIGGFVTLVMKLGDRSRDDDDNDGAVV